MVLNWKFSDDIITQITYMKYEEKFLILDYAGRILIYDPIEHTSKELEGHKKLGYYQGILTERDEFLTMVGYKDQIKKWNLTMNIRLGTETRDSLDDDRTDYKWFHYFEDK